MRMILYSTGERKRRPRGDRKSMEMSQHLKQTFEATIKVGLFPRSQIDIFVEVLQVNSSCQLYAHYFLHSPL